MIREDYDSFSVGCELRLRRQGQKLLRFWVDFGCGWWYGRESVLLPPLDQDRVERDYEKDYLSDIPGDPGSQLPYQEFFPVT